MSARQPHRALIYTAALAAITLVAGCATTTSGSGHLAANATTTLPGQGPGLPTGGSTGFPNPGSTDFPGQAPTGIPGRPATTTPNESTNSALRPACRAVSPKDLKEIFGERFRLLALPVPGDSCMYISQSGGGLEVFIADDESLNEAKAGIRGGKKDLTIAGKAAVNQNNKAILVSRSQDPSKPGIIVSRNLYSNHSIGISKLTALLEKLVPAYPV